MVSGSAREEDIDALPDRHEEPSEMESMLLAEGSRHRPALNDIAVELAAASAGLRRSLPTGVTQALADR
jgi:hypothetical protein